MPNSTISPRKSRLVLVIVAGLIALILFFGNVASNLIAADLDAKLKPYRLWVWGIFIIALIVAVVVAANETRRVASSAHPKDYLDEDEQRPRQDIGGAAKPDQIIHLYNAPAPTASALHQLPSPPRDFTGRQQELDELMSTLEHGGVTISGLQGLGGVGKTALALKLAQQLAPRYPDAQFYLDLKGASKTPLSPSEAMAHVIRAYQPTAKLPESEAELSALYRSVLHNQRALLLMDNAFDRNQVEPLIPPESCVMLVTSRHHFTLPGLFPKNLDTLSAEDSQKLLLKIAPRIGGQANTLAKLCGHLPLALRLAASVLAERLDLRVDNYVQRLSNAQQRLELVDASLNLSYNSLSTEMQRRFCLLAVFPNTFDAAAATFVSQLISDVIQDALSELVKYSLLDWDEATTRYSLHDLVRLFADAHLNDAERYQGQGRHATYYLSILAEANKLYIKGAEALKKGLVLIDLEWPNIQAGQAWAEKHAGEDNTVAFLCGSYPDAGVHLLKLRVHPRERIRWLESALSAARQTRHRGLEGAHLRSLGHAYGDLGETRRALEFYEQCLTINREIGSRLDEGMALGSLGVAYASLGELRRAIELFKQWLVITRELDDRNGEAEALGNLGHAHNLLGESRRAIEFLEQALTIFRETGRRLSEGMALGGLGVTYASLNEMRRAMDCYEQYLSITREIGDLRGEGIALWNISLVLRQQGKGDEAIAHGEMALKIYEQVEDPHAVIVRERLAKWRGQE